MKYLSVLPAAALTFALGGCQDEHLKAHGDFNGDGIGDTVYARKDQHIAANTWNVYLSTDRGETYSPVCIGVQGAEMRPLSVGDHDGDGDADVALAVFGQDLNGEGPSQWRKYLLEGNNDGTFKPLRQFD